MADYPVRVGDPLLRAQLQATIDIEGKIPRALDALGPVHGKHVVLLDADRGVRAAQLEELGAQVTALPSLVTSSLPQDAADVVVSCWAGFRGGAPETEAQVQEAQRVLRPAGRLLLVHDYGRDDVSRLNADDVLEREHVAWSRLDGWFLLHDFKVRVLHCSWTFDSLEVARDLLSHAFGRPGAEVAEGLRRPRLEYKVAVYHRTLGLPPA